MEQLPILPRQASIHISLVQTLNEMGFQQEFVDAAIAYTGSMNLDDLLRFLIKGDNGWEHEFIPDEQNLCELCKEPLQEHFVPDNQPRKSITQLYEEIKINQERVSMRLSKEILIDNGNLCEICYEPLLEKWVLPSCGVHEFCKNCFVQHVESLIKDSKVAHILCPGKDCQIEFDENDVKKIVSEENFTKYIKFKERAVLMIDPSVKWCSQPNCEGYVRGNNEDKKLSCPKCGFELCFQCGKAWHPKKTCEQIIDEDYELWAKGKEIQLCPKCKHKIEKFDGCNHMTCASCNYNWCWLCRGHYTSNHYSKLNPLGCPNLQSGYNSRQAWPMWKIYLARCRGLCLWLLIIIFLPLIIVFGPALYATKSLYKDIKRKSCIFISFILVLVFLGITIITPPGYVIAIPVLIFVGIRKCCKKCKSCF